MRQAERSPPALTGPDSYLRAESVRVGAHGGLRFPSEWKTAFGAVFSRLYDAAMSSPPRDTHPAAHCLQIELLRRASPARRFALVSSLTRFAVEASRRALRERHPDEDERSIAVRWVAVHYGKELAARLAVHLEGGDA